MNYNQVVVKCQILQVCFLQNFNMQKFQNMEHSNSRTFKDPMNPVYCTTLTLIMRDFLLVFSSRIEEEHVEISENCFISSKLK